MTQSRPGELFSFYTYSTTSATIAQQQQQIMADKGTQEQAKQSTIQYLKAWGGKPSPSIAQRTQL